MKQIIAFIFVILSFSVAAQNLPEAVKVLETENNCEIKAALWELKGTSLGLLEIRKGKNSKFKGLVKNNVEGRDFYYSVDDQIPTFELRMTLAIESSLPRISVFYSGRYFQCWMNHVYDESSLSNVGSIGHQEFH